MPRILLVDTDDTLANELKSNLPKFGVDYLQHGKEALDRIISGQRYDLIISEVSMNGVDGLTLLKMVNHFQGSVFPFILVSDSDSAEVKQLGNTLGIIGHFVKPVDLEDLKKAILKLFPQKPSPNVKDLYDFWGRLEHMGLDELIQIFHLGKKSGILELTTSSGDGHMAFIDGEMVRAATSDLKGRGAMEEMVSWDRGEFGIFFGEVQESKREGGGQTQRMLLESLELLDQKRKSNQ